MKFLVVLQLALFSWFNVAYANSNSISMGGVEVVFEEALGEEYHQLQLEKNAELLVLFKDNAIYDYSKESGATTGELMKLKDEAQVKALELFKRIQQDNPNVLELLNVMELMNTIVVKVDLEPYFLP